MKLLSSSSSSASSTITTTTSTSFDGNAHNSESSSATSGCIAGMFRRLLCRNSLPTFPSDHFREVEQDFVDFDKLPCMKAVESFAVPSLVARLMGLESLPEFDVVNTRKTPNSISRSRSMNSLDSLKELQSIQGRHRLVKSFRETPTFLELEDDNFFILSFEYEDANLKSELKGRKSEMGSVQMKQRNKDNCKAKNKRRGYEKNKENQDTTNVSVETLEKAMNSAKGSQRVRCDGKLEDLSNILRPTKNSYQNLLAGMELAMLAKPAIHKPESERRRMRTKKTKDDYLPLKKIEPECDSENSSPNSVLHVTDFPCDPEVSSSEEISRLENSKSRRTLTEEHENYRKLNQYNCKTLFSKACKSGSAEGKYVQLRKNNHNNHRYIAMWCGLSRLTEKEIAQCNWIQKEIQKMEDYREISGELGLEILDQLLGELVDQLHGSFHQIF